VSSLFDNALRSRCEADPDVAPLGAQWEFDRRLIASALSGVALTFPHYSRHDASHSNTILLQLARVMGPDRIKELSATDVWLLLEAAYYHDLGMVLTDEEARKHWRSPEFESFIQQLQTSNEMDLRHAAELARGAMPDSLPADWALDVRRAVVILLADFIRRQHAGRSRSFAWDPGVIGLESPRTGLLPGRLFSLLGDICHSHGQTFEETMKLPKVASGMGTDDAHPRFVACMLRVGDLLDLDNGRFCPVMQRIMGAIPSSSQAHVEKHAAIKHVLVSPELIEVDAECETYPGYEATWQWLDWLKREIKSQMLRWNEITPRGFGSLPSLGRIETRQKNYLALQPGERPRFDIDRDATLKLLRGANLYPHREDAIPELIQNAIDATLLRLWGEEWSRLSPDQLRAKQPADARMEIMKYGIDITLTRINDGEEWRIEIQDQGTGIAFSDLRYLLTVGSSRKNPERSQTIQRMPEWMRPSGIFGIGLQSVFLITDEVILTTRHHDTGEAYEITLRADEYSDSSGLLLRKLQGAERAKVRIGTLIVFSVRTGRFPPSVGPVGSDLAAWRSSSRHSGEAARIVNEFDPTLHEELPYFIACVRDLIQRLATESLCILRINGEPAAAPSSASALVFDQLTGCEFEFWFRLHEPVNLFYLGSASTTEIWYRGAPVTGHFRKLLVSVVCNAHIGRADEFLTLDRRTLTERGRSELHRRIDDALVRLLPDRLRYLRSTDPRQAQVASLLAHLKGLPEAGDDWRGIALKGGGGVAPLTLDKILAKSSITHWEHDVFVGEFAIVEAEPGKVTLSGDADWLHQLLQKHSFRCSYDGTLQQDGSPPQQPQKYLYERSSEPIIITDNGILDLLLNKLPRRDIHSGITFRRSTIPCQRGFEALRIVEVEHLGFTRAIPRLSSRMVNPFTIAKSEDSLRVAVPHVSALVDWTHLHSETPAPSKAAIANAVSSFIEKIDGLLKERRDVVRDYDLAKLRLELGKFTS